MLTYMLTLDPKENYSEFVFGNVLGALLAPVIQLFIVLKLDKVILMNWYMAFLPAWVTMALQVVVSLWKAW